MSSNSTNILVDEYRGHDVAATRESARDHGVLTVLDDDARYVVPVHPSCRGVG
jgi:hypothetical protein